VPTKGASDEVPVGTILRGEPGIGEAGDAFAPVHAGKPVVKPSGLLRPAVPSEVGARELPAEPLALVESPALALAAGGSGGPAPGGLRAPRAPGNMSTPINPFRPEFHEDVWLPPLSLLHSAYSAVAPMSQDDLIEGGILIEEKLAEFRVKVNVQDAYAGPVITRYEVQPATGVRGGQVVSLMKDLARALGVASIRVVETIPGKTCMGLELPNPRRQMIHLSEVLSSEVFRSHASKLAMALGKDITGEPVVADLAKAPHMLVAGTTGSGKSVGVNAMILSLLYRATPDEVRFVMIDPKMLELSIYDGIPHLLAPVVTDMKLAANALNWCVGEMERRYRLMSGLGVRNLAGYNQKVRDADAAGEQPVDPFSVTPDNPAPLSPLPYVVVVVDELADLMMVSGKKIEELIARLAQKARAAGIHLILATQRPSVDVITGLIKANIPTRIAFQVSSKIDSRTILDQMGAECLLGQGDMPGTGYPQRVHGAFVADEEVHAVAEHLKQLGEPHYVDGVLGGAVDAEDGGADAERFGDESGPLYDDAVAFVINSRRASISAVQRQLRIGYNRAARLVEQKETGSIRKTAALLKVSRNAVRRKLRSIPSAPAGKLSRKSKLDPYKAKISYLVREKDLSAVRILEEIQPLGYGGGYTILKDYIRSVRIRKTRGPTAPIDHQVGHETQMDWSPHRVTIGGREVIVHTGSLILCFSRWLHLRFFTDETLESVIALHREAFERIQGVPATITYDNMTTVGRHVGPKDVW
jgi:S-DNA-T family DNA segregation ATPase FtsK/SpoIIIE